MTKKTETKKEIEKSALTPFYSAVGRRKAAVARARLHTGKEDVIVNGKKLEKGEVYVNEKPITEYFVGPYAKALYTEIFRTTNTVDRFITTVLVEGSGSTGQLGAVSLAIARALCLFDPSLRAILRKKGYMTRDPRAKERKKPGLPGARKKKSSPKR